MDINRYTTVANTHTIQRHTRGGGCWYCPYNSRWLVYIRVYTRQPQCVCCVPGNVAKSVQAGVTQPHSRSIVSYREWGGEGRGWMGTHRVGLRADLLARPTYPTGNLAAQLWSFVQSLETEHTACVLGTHTPQSNINPLQPSSLHSIDRPHRLTTGSSLATRVEVMLQSWSYTYIS